MPPTRPQTKELTLIVAATSQTLGIGRHGTLPWPRLKGEIGYFARVTKRASPSPSPSADHHDGSAPRLLNAVIMGRKTWDSIPAKQRPLRGRFNVVVSGSLAASASAEGQLHHVAASLPSAVDYLTSPTSSSFSLGPVGASHSEDKTQQIDRIFVIGGASLYDAALAHPLTRRVLLTSVKTEFECDTFFPLDLDGAEAGEKGWRRREEEGLRDWVGGEAFGAGEEGPEREEEGVRYEFRMYEREGDGV